MKGRKGEVELALNARSTSKTFTAPPVRRYASCTNLFVKLFSCS